MGLPRDVFAVSMAYATADPPDRVGQHNSLYLSLFGRDLHPGERWQTVVRLVVGPFGQDPEQHRALYAAFLQAYQDLPAVLEVDDPPAAPRAATVTGRWVRRGSGWRPASQPLMAPARIPSIRRR